MKKETIEIKAAYMAPEVKAFAIQPSVAVMSNVDGVFSYSDDAEEFEYGEY